MSVVHSSRGPAGTGVGSAAGRAGDHLPAGQGRCWAPEHPVDWEAMAADYDVIRDHISRVIPGFADYNERVRTKNGFVLPHPPRDTRSFAHRDRQGAAHRQRADLAAGPDGPAAAADPALARPVQHHDLRPGRPLPRHLRGPPGGAGQSGRHRRARPGRPAVGRRDQRMADPGRGARTPGRAASGWSSYPTTPGCAAAYYPEANVLVPTNSVADESGTPTSKGVVVRLEPAVGCRRTAVMHRCSAARPRLPRHRRSANRPRTRRSAGKAPRAVH